jgi:hypothetical protein
MSDDASTSFVRPMRLLTRFAVAAALILGAGAMVAPAQAHGRLGAAEGRCKLFIGPDTMNFTGYLPEASKNEFCEDIPSTGPMIMVLDAEQAELRDMKIELRIVKDVGAAAEDENLDAVTVAYKPPLTYPSGTVNFEHNFKDGGYFVGIVTVLGDHGERWVSRFPFSVDRTFMRDLPVYLMMALGVIAAFVIYLIHRRRNPPPTLTTAAAAFKAPYPSLWAETTGAAAAPESTEPGLEADTPASDKGDDDHDDSDKYRTAAE